MSWKVTQRKEVYSTYRMLAPEFRLRNASLKGKGKRESNVSYHFRRWRPCGSEESSLRECSGLLSSGEKKR